MFWKKKEKSLKSLMKDRSELEKKIELLNKQILDLQRKCEHNNFGDFENMKGEGYTVCTDCYAELVRIY
jgi:peptidoglycan hydrolase CwlO-like protein